MRRLARHHLAVQRLRLRHRLRRAFVLEQNRQIHLARECLHVLRAVVRRLARHHLAVQRLRLAEHLQLREQVRHLHLGAQRGVRVPCHAPRLTARPRAHLLERQPVELRAAPGRLHRRQDHGPVRGVARLRVRDVDAVEDVEDHVVLLEQRRLEGAPLRRAEADAEARIGCLRRAVQLPQAPGARERRGRVPRREQHHRVPDQRDGLRERRRPPLLRQRLRRVLVYGKAVEPDELRRRIRGQPVHEGTERRHDVGELVEPGVGEEDRRPPHQVRRGWVVEQQLAVRARAWRHRTLRLAPLPPPVPVLVPAPAADIVAVRIDGQRLGLVDPARRHRRGLDQRVAGVAGRAVRREGAPLGVLAQKGLERLDRDAVAGVLGGGGGRGGRRWFLD